MNSAQLRADFYAALENGERRKAHRIARRLMEFTTGAERVRWHRWYAATKRGRNVRVGTFPAEVYAGRDLQNLEEARGFLGDDKRVAEAVEFLKEAE